MRIAITGGSGRVGRAVIELALAQGHSVVSIDRVQPAEGSLADNVTFIQASITDYADFESAIQRLRRAGASGGLPVARRPPRLRGA